MEPKKALAAATKEFFDVWVKRHPLLGVSFGFLQNYAEQVPDGSLKAEQDDHKILRKTLETLKAIDPKKLSAKDTVEHQLAMHLVDLWLFEREELKLWEMIPEAPQVVGQCIYQLLCRSTVPLNLRIRAIMKRLERLPKYIDESRQKLLRPTKLFVEHELETLSRLPAFFNHVKDLARDHLPPTPQRQLHRLLENVQNALQRYEDWLIIDILPDCRNEWWIGEEMYRKLLAKRGVTAAPATLIKAAEEEVERLRERLKEIGRSIKRKVMLEDVRDLIKAQHPDNFDGVLRYTRDTVGKLKSFVNRTRFALLPDHDALFVVDTPIFYRHLHPLGHHVPPAKFEAKDAKHDGYYLVTPGDCDSDKLKEHNGAALLWRAIYYAFPGRHLQDAWAVKNASTWRSFAASPESLDGWAHYCQERVREMGYDDSPQTRFMGIVDAVHRAGMVLMDAKLNTGRMTINQAVEWLIDFVGMDRVCGEAEVRRYVTLPTAGVGAFWGKEQIKELKKHVKERMKARFSETFFHTAFLQAAPLPLPIMKLELERRLEEELRHPTIKVIEEPEEGKRPKKDKGGAEFKPIENTRIEKSMKKFAPALEFEKPKPLATVEPPKGPVIPGKPALKGPPPKPTPPAKAKPVAKKAAPKAKPKAKPKKNRK
jgi:uncharacterized protein (DUF885 family)